MTPSRPRILIVEDEAIVREDLRDMLVSLGYDIADTAMSGPEAIRRALESRPDLVLMDIRLRGPMDGIEAATRIHDEVGSPVVFLTAFADDPTLQRAKAAAPFGYLTKPLHDRALRAAIEMALHRHARSHDERPSPAAQHEPVADEITGDSPAIQSVREQIARLGPADITVLIEGETGTGKELAARALHHANRRRTGPFIAVNCAALTESLAAAEFFGHRRGAFTGATTDRQGVFEAASGGTLFLDEIGDIPKTIQPHLLRVLEERAITRVGDSFARPVDVRVVAATHRNLEDEVAAGRLRADLLYRIRVGRLRVPPLRDRTSDIPRLAENFHTAFSRQLGRLLPRLSPEILDLLSRYPWPGNVRELRNAVEFSALRSEGDLILPGDLPAEIGAARSLPPPGPSQPPVDDRTLLAQALQQTGGNRTQTARLLGISRATLYRRLSELGLDGG
ncbi:MAG: sigma-54-dependent transcriptional regulator [Limisphaerales bacterium]